MSEPLSRRAALAGAARTLASVSALAVPAVAIAATAPTGADAELLALGAEILKRCAAADAFSAARIDPYNERFCELAYDDGSRVTDASLKRAFAYSHETGRDDAIGELREYDSATDTLFARLMAIPATTQPGRAAKVRALLVHVLRTGWLGPANELEWDKDVTRALLAEFAGMSAEEVAAI